MRRRFEINGGLVTSHEIIRVCQEHRVALSRGKSEGLEVNRYKSKLAISFAIS